jgi:hypothetical protein
MMKITAKIALSLGLFWIAGCGQSLPPAADPAVARSTLEKSLDAWRSGSTPDSLKAQSPAIYLNDPDFASGKQLVAYQIESEEAAGVSWRCEVLITVKENGAEQQRRVLYCIDVDPALVVVREPS